MGDLPRIDDLCSNMRAEQRVSEPQMRNVRRVVRSLRERERRLKLLRLGKGPGDTDCFHCGQMFFMHQSRGGRFGLCQPCLDD
jgi:hypothetical protein